MDKIFITALRAETVIGIYDWEKATRQRVTVDLELDTDTRRAAQTDDIADTINYKSISKRLVRFIEESRYELLETLAEQLARLLVEEFGVSRVALTLHKPGALSDADDVGMKIVRTAADFSGAAA
ncbi:dihydroneopterin aldolase [Granulosicoccaceae sp. 1_MG-2023]|nr:dihydroneopterin aldolase [Granulosicoccaceae sp. 1_MG-2023]